MSERQEHEPIAPEAVSEQSEGQRYAAKRGSVGSRVATAVRTVGVWATARRAVEFGSAKVRAAVTPLVAPLFRKRTFTYQGRVLSYMVFKHNATWSNERVIELAIVRDELARGGRSVCEIGAVLHHYPELCAQAHTTIDKYEHADGVIQMDVLDFLPEERFDLVISVSTLEHLGIDEHDHPDAPERALRALSHVAEHLLQPGGRAVVTVPLGYNPQLDELVGGDIGVDGVSVGAVYRRETGLSNRWVECSASDVAGATYGEPYRTASAIAVLRVESPS